HQRQSLLDGPQPGLGQMLPRPWRVAKPRIVGEIEQPAGPVVRLDRSAGKDDLVTDQRANRWSSGEVEGAPPRTGREAARQFGQLAEAEALEEILEGQELAEGDEIDLVIGGQDRAVIAEDLDAVEIAR